MERFFLQHVRGEKGKKSGEPLTCSHGVKKEEKLAHSRTDIEGIEGLLEAPELGKGWDQLQDVVLQVLNNNKNNNNNNLNILKVNKRKIEEQTNKQKHTNKE